MSAGRLVVLLLAVAVASAGLATVAAVLLAEPDHPTPVERIELRKDDAPAEVVAEEEGDFDGDPDGLPTAASLPGDPTSHGGGTTAGGLTTAADARGGVPASPAFAASMDGVTSSDA